MSARRTSSMTPQAHRSRVCVLRHDDLFYACGRELVGHLDPRDRPPSIEALTRAWHPPPVVQDPASELVQRLPLVDAATVASQDLFLRDREGRTIVSDAMLDAYKAGVLDRAARITSSPDGRRRLDRASSIGAMVVPRVKITPLLLVQVRDEWSAAGALDLEGQEALVAGSAEEAERLAMQERIDALYAASQLAARRRNDIRRGRLGLRSLSAPPRLVRSHATDAAASPVSPSAAPAGNAPRRHSWSGFPRAARIEKILLPRLPPPQDDDAEAETRCASSTSSSRIAAPSSLLASGGGGSMEGVIPDLELELSSSEEGSEEEHEQEEQHWTDGGDRSASRSPEVDGDAGEAEDSSSRLPLLLQQQRGSHLSELDGEEAWSHAVEGGTTAGAGTGLSSPLSPRFRAQLLPLASPHAHSPAGTVAAARGTAAATAPSSPVHQFPAPATPQLTRVHPSPRPAAAASHTALSSPSASSVALSPSAASVTVDPVLRDLQPVSYTHL